MHEFNLKHAVFTSEKWVSNVPKLSYQQVREDPPALPPIPPFPLSSFSLPSPPLSLRYTPFIPHCPFPTISGEISWRLWKCSEWKVKSSQMQFFTLKELKYLLRVSRTIAPGKQWAKLTKQPPPYLRTLLSHFIYWLFLSAWYPSSSYIFIWILTLLYIM